MVPRQVDKLDRLFTSDGGEAFQEVVERRIAFDVIDQRLYRNTGPFEARLTAHPVGIDPDDIV